jgi:predicted RNase H-like HicB family nuclease
MQSLNLKLSVLLFPENGAWVAQCLQHNIAEQGATIDEAISNWTTALVTHISSDIEDKRTPLEGVEKAPMEFWGRWIEAKLLNEQPLNLPGNVPPAWMIPAIANDLRLGR